MTDKSSSPGRKLPQGNYAVFVPASLPPTLHWTPRLIGVLSDADRSIGKLAGDSTNMPLRVVELLTANPFITIKSVARKLGVAFATAQRAIEWLERLGIVKQSGDAKRDRVYYAKALLDIHEEPAQLTSVEGA